MKPHTLHRLKQEFAYFRPSIPPGKAHRRLVRVILAYLQAKDAKGKRVNREIRRGRGWLRWRCEPPHATQHARACDVACGYGRGVCESCASTGQDEAR